MKCDIINLSKQKVGELELKPEVFECQMREDILHRVIHWQLAKRRQGSHKAKIVSEVSGTTKKSVKQKGTGGARHGSRRAVQFRGGGVCFGPVVRDHGYSLPKKVRKLGLRVALSAKATSGKLLVVDQFAVEDGKTKSLKQIMANLGVNSALLITGETVDQKILLSGNNLAKFDVLPQIGANVYDIIKSDYLILTKDAVEMLEGRLQ